MPIIRIYEHKKNISHSKMCNARAPLIDRLHTYCRLNADLMQTHADFAKNPPSCLYKSCVPAACCLSGVRAPAYCLLAADSICRNLKDLLPHSTFFSRCGTFSCIPPRGSKFRVVMATLFPYGMINHFPSPKWDTICRINAT